MVGCFWLLWSGAEFFVPDEEFFGAFLVCVCLSYLLLAYFYSRCFAGILLLWREKRR